MRIKYNSSEPVVHYPEGMTREDRWRNKDEAKATQWEAPFWQSSRIFLALVIATIVAAILFKSLDVLVYGTLIAFGTAALNLVGIFYLTERLLSYAFAPRMNVDGNMDGSTSPEEVEEALHLFTPQGIAAFVKHWMYEIGDWRYGTLVDKGPLSGDEYKWIVNDILPEVGVLEKNVAKNRSRRLEMVDGQTISQDEAVDRVLSYFKRSKRKVWQFNIMGRNVTL